MTERNKKFFTESRVISPQKLHYQHIQKVSKKSRILKKKFSSNIIKNSSKLQLKIKDSSIFLPDNYSQIDNNFLEYERFDSNLVGYEHTDPSLLEYDNIDSDASTEAEEIESLSHDSHFSFLLKDSIPSVYSSSKLLPISKVENNSSISNKSWSRGKTLINKDSENSNKVTSNSKKKSSNNAKVAKQPDYLPPQNAQPIESISLGSPLGSQLNEKLATDSLHLFKYYTDFSYQCQSDDIKPKASKSISSHLPGDNDCSQFLNNGNTTNMLNFTDLSSKTQTIALFPDSRVLGKKTLNSCVIVNPTVRDQQSKFDLSCSSHIDESSHPTEITISPILQINHLQPQIPVNLNENSTQKNTFDNINFYDFSTKPFASLIPKNTHQSEPLISHSITENVLSDTSESSVKRVTLHNCPSAHTKDVDIIPSIQLSDIVKIQSINQKPKAFPTPTPSDIILDPIIKSPQSPIVDLDPIANYISNTSSKIENVPVVPEIAQISNHKVSIATPDSKLSNINPETFNNYKSLSSPLFDHLNISCESKQFFHGKFSTTNYAQTQYDKPSNSLNQNNSILDQPSEFIHLDFDLTSDSHISSPIPTKSSDAYLRQNTKKPISNSTDPSFRQLDIISKISSPASTPKSFLKRSYIIKEICYSESLYINDLKLIELYFSQPLINDCILSPVEAKIISRNISQLCNIHSQVLKFFQINSDLEDIITGLNNLSNKFSEYIEYFIGQSSATQLIDNLSTNKSFSSFLTKSLLKINESSGNRRLGIQDLLIKPIQRIFKYPLFIEDLLSTLPESITYHHKLVKIKNKINSVCLRINESQKTASMSELTIRFIQSYQGNPFLPKSVICKLGVIQLSGSLDVIDHPNLPESRKNAKTYGCVLFSRFFIVNNVIKLDNSIFIEPKYWFPLHSMDLTVQNNNNNSSNFRKSGYNSAPISGWRLIHIKSGQFMDFSASTKQENKIWVDSMINCISESKSRANIVRQKKIIKDFDRNPQTEKSISEPVKTSAVAVNPSPKPNNLFKSISEPKSLIRPCSLKSVNSKLPSLSQPNNSPVTTHERNKSSSKDFYHSSSINSNEKNSDIFLKRNNSLGSKVSEANNSTSLTDSRALVESFFYSYTSDEIIKVRLSSKINRKESFLHLGSFINSESATFSILKFGSRSNSENKKAKNRSHSQIYRHSPNIKPAQFPATKFSNFKESSKKKFSLVRPKFFIDDDLDKSHSVQSNIHHDIQNDKTKSFTNCYDDSSRASYLNSPSGSANKFRPPNIESKGPDYELFANKKLSSNQSQKINFLRKSFSNSKDKDFSILKSSSDLKLDFSSNLIEFTSDKSKSDSKFSKFRRKSHTGAIAKHAGINKSELIHKESSEDLVHFNIGSSLTNDSTGSSAQVSKIHTPKPESAYSDDSSEDDYSISQILLKSKSPSLNAFTNIKINNNNPGKSPDLNFKADNILPDYQKIKKNNISLSDLSQSNGKPPKIQPLKHKGSNLSEKINSSSNLELPSSSIRHSNNGTSISSFVVINDSNSIDTNNTITSSNSASKTPTPNCSGSDRTLSSSASIKSLKIVSSSNHFFADAQREWKEKSNKFLYILEKLSNKQTKKTQRH
ncbi:Phosphatidylinositol 3,4,5-trisphosphate-dependent Rac exchanger 2 protein [Smittium culicis]|uniref:Phosphatidylinositol 3,4,5-trisphosphate-dependent Rac exchanger 2 protein n=1 Tax=Smittium culicis TaxID=133412 RepID=A0A1R1YQ62_9FUNG|nr:Phosphatidylinositol 3,4,5-trisphosphate-dependent Rac exchanger 2 protein [Smittium culicis]